MSYLFNHLDSFTSVSILTNFTIFIIIFLSLFSTFNRTDMTSFIKLFIISIGIVLISIDFIISYNLITSISSYWTSIDGKQDFFILFLFYMIIINNSSQYIDNNDNNNNNLMT